MANIVCNNCFREFEHGGTRGPKPKKCPDCSNRYAQVSLIQIQISKAKYGWTKYGGARQGLVKQETTYWCCQACGKDQVKSLPAYMFDIDRSREFLRICAECQNTTRKENIESFDQLIKMVRPNH